MMNKVHVELSSVCSKNCWMCGRRKRDREHGTQDYGFMDWKTVVRIAHQVPQRTLVAFHNNGEALHYPQLAQAIRVFKHCITYTVSNGLLLVDRANDLIGNLDILSISIIENEEPEVKEYQYSQILEFLSLKGTRSPMVTLRFVGNVDESYYTGLSLPIIHRTLHIPDGSRIYRKTPVRPEHNICQDLLTTLAINRYGDVSLCVRYDPKGELVLGNVEYMTLNELWNCQKRLWTINKFMQGKRYEVPYCGDQCDFWGVPTAD